ncbi:hypothetical protein [Planctomycetes bacterium K23_9]|uniref:Uncharacterized protein n=1 Tax=Stieleria marina TaxID=1930275 RepID=A0A517P369_9BACT|nr:hypothetical protein K239x_58270 [Planctomycetes bacterium K23_9]
MKSLSVTALLLACSACISACSVVQADEKSLTWTKAFEPNSARDSADKLILLLITNDDPFVENSSHEPRSLWCTPLVESVLQEVSQARDDLKEKFILQSLAAGTPKLLSAGKDRNKPERAIIAVCDTNYRLLGLQTGVPELSNMLTLIEDAQFASALLNAPEGKNQKAARHRADEITQYYAQRLPRLWSEAQQEIVAKTEQDADDESVKSTSVTSTNLTRRKLANIGEALDEIYLADVKRRFSLNEPSDLLRLAVIEQHPQVRQPWCDAIFPLVAGTDFQTHWQSLVELIWKRSPVTESNHDQPLIEWWDRNAASNTVVFSIEPPILDSLRRWPPINVDNAADRLKLGWRDLENVAAKVPFRHVTHQQLATVMRIKGLQPIDTELPSRGRYVVFDPGRKTGIVIHENDLPAKHIGRIKRAIKK